VTKVGVIVDLGNSETRVGVFINEKWLEKNVTNSFAALEIRYALKNEYRNSKTTILRHRGAWYANGQLVDMEFINRELRPSSLEEKAKQISTPLSLIMILYTVHTMVSNELGVSMQDLELDIDFTIALPPLEHDVSEAEMEKLVREITEIEVCSPIEWKKNISISRVRVVPEGVSAFFGAFYEERDGALVECSANQQFSQGYVLIVDIGAGTTDVALIKDTELQLESKDTFNKLGGNLVDSILQVELKKQYKVTPSKAAIREVVQTGHLTIGAKGHDVADVLSLVKRNFSQRLNNQLRTYFERISVDLMEIKGLLLIGGGGLASMFDGNVTTQPLSEYFMEYFRTLAPYCELVNTRGLNLRRMNFEGMKFIHRYS
jgi:hypothetical protein